MKIKDTFKKNHSTNQLEIKNENQGTAIALLRQIRGG
jgi:hypothetical protein